MRKIGMKNRCAVVLHSSVPTQGAAGQQTCK